MSSVSGPARALGAVPDDRRALFLTEQGKTVHGSEQLTMKETFITIRILMNTIKKVHNITHKQLAKNV